MFDERWLSPGGVVPVDPQTTGDLVREILRLRAELETRPRTEFYAVGWWDGKKALLDDDYKMVRGMLLFRPVPSRGAAERNITGETK